MGRQRIMWLALGIAVAIGLGLALWPSGGQSQSSSPVDTSSVREQIQVTTGSDQPRARGGTGDTGRIKEGVEYVIRDASDKIKEQEAVGGQ